jgi:hypothetical protein
VVAAQKMPRAWPATGGGVRVLRRGISEGV